MPLLTTRAGASARAYGATALLAKGDAMTAIATSTPSGVSTVAFSSIPQGYDDLFISANVRFASGSFLIGRINGSTSTIYDQLVYGSAPPAARTHVLNSQSHFWGNYTSLLASNANFSASYEIDIPNYASSSHEKTVFVRSSFDMDGQGAGTEFSATAWRSTSPVTSLTFLLSNNGLFSSQTVVALYGIKRA